MGGIDGREVELVVVDAALESDVAPALVADDLIGNGDIAAIVGMHISAVRQELRKAVRGRIPYVYTPLYEGNEQTPGVYAIGETPQDQLRPAIERLARLHRVCRWALVGNDYIWPRASHAFARQYIRESGGELVLETYVPFGVDAAESLVERVQRSGADVVLVSLVGQDAVEFNRVFGASGLDRRIVRLSTAIEENALLAIGEKNTKRMYCASSYFAALATEKNQMFKEKYYSMHGLRAPTLNALGQSIYEGAHFLKAFSDRRRRGSDSIGPITYRSARGAVYLDNQTKHLPVYLARADGHCFAVQERLR